MGSSAFDIVLFALITFNRMPHRLLLALQGSQFIYSGKKNLGFTKISPKQKSRLETVVKNEASLLFLTGCKCIPKFIIFHGSSAQTIAQNPALAWILLSHDCQFERIKITCD